MPPACALTSGRPGPRARITRGPTVTADRSHHRGGGALPNLIIIGALKAGTTSLHSYLDAHPEVGMSQIKELDFFIEPGHLGRGPDWYRSHFDPAYRVRGEASPRYAMRPMTDPVAERIRRLAPDTRLIYLVRDPISRAVSHYLHHRRIGREFQPIDQALSVYRHYYVELSRYRYQLEPFLQTFGQERILILCQEKLRRERREAMREVFTFLGVDPTFDSPKFERELMVTAEQGDTLLTARRLATRLGIRGAWPKLPLPVRQAVRRGLK